MLIEHIIMQGERITRRHEIAPSNVDTLSRHERRKLDRAYRIAARKRDKQRSK